MEKHAIMFVVFAMTALFAGCDTGYVIPCQPGTELTWDGFCVPADDLATCGEGTVKHNGTCVPEQEMKPAKQVWQEVKPADERLAPSCKSIKTPGCLGAELTLADDTPSGQAFVTQKLHELVKFNLQTTPLENLYMFATDMKIRINHEQASNAGANSYIRVLVNGAEHVLHQASTWQDGAEYILPLDIPLYPGQPVEINVMANTMTLGEPEFDRISVDVIGLDTSPAYQVFGLPLKGKVVSFGYGS